MRSMARWVLPVLVGPSTAVTPAPRPPGLRLVGDENEMGISRPIKLAFRVFRGSSDYYDGLARVDVRRSHERAGRRVARASRRVPHGRYLRRRFRGACV